MISRSRRKVEAFTDPRLYALNRRLAAAPERAEQRPAGRAIGANYVGWRGQGILQSVASAVATLRPSAYTPRAMPDLNHLIANNRAWAAETEARQPGFFATLAEQQSPQYMWIGCSDSRVPANQITGLLPGEIFVHRNIANVVVHTDLNCLSVLQFAVDVIKVRHVLVVGHYGCAGVMAALLNRRVGLADNWLRHVQDVRLKHAALLETVPEDARPDRLVELNVIEQVVNVCQTNIVQDAWDRGQDLTVHGWVYALKDGLIRDLQMNADSPENLARTHESAIARAGRAEATSGPR
jgi:carbonic anhydrase